jgi:hypothetical protein
MTKQPKSQYQSYLLRLWRTGEGEVCRAMLEHIDSHERFGFANLEELCAFLREQMHPTPVKDADRQTSVICRPKGKK